MTDCPNTEAADAYGNAWAAIYDDEYRFLVPGKTSLACSKIWPAVAPLSSSGSGPAASPCPWPREEWS